MGKGKWRIHVKRGIIRGMWQEIKNLYHLVVAVAATLWFGFPSKKFTVVGVTGTDGKTTTTNLIAHILRENGKKVCVISTIGVVINEKFEDTGFHFTTPSAWKVQEFFYKALQNNTHTKEDNYMVLEVSSHALHQNRVFGIDFTVGVLTNVTHEHLDYHGIYQNYVQVKARLLERSLYAITNKDDDSYRIVKEKEKIKKPGHWITYGMQNADITPQVFPFTTQLFGLFNKYNALAAIAVCRVLKVDDTRIRKALQTFKPPKGRQEIIHDGDFTVMVDFAHTPNAFEKLLSEAVKGKKKRLIHVFGSAGERDKSKRPTMGKMSSQYADIMILTAEDPRTEDVITITNEIISGITTTSFVTLTEPEVATMTFKHDQKYIVIIPNRRRAIHFAIKIAEKGDYVLLTGKGHEQSINYGQGEEPWDESAVAYEALKHT